MTRRLLGLLVVIATAQIASAQNAFSPAVRVGDGIVTLYELDQRALFLTLLNAGDDTRSLALEQLVNERIQIDQAAAFGVTLPEETFLAAEAEFASQGEFTREEFVAALEEQGVGISTFQNFVRAGLLWREVVGAEFANRINVTDEEVDRVLASIPSQGGVRVLVNEIFLPAGDPQTEAASRRRAARIAQLTDIEEFQSAARLFSIANSRFNGGEVDWRPVEAFPPEIAGRLVGLRPGQVAGPAFDGRTLGLFQLREIETVQPGRREVVSVEYALFRPGDSGLFQRAAQNARTCDDLYGFAKGLPPERLERNIQRVSTLPPQIAREIENLDANEISLNLSRANQPALLMLCRRTLNESSAVDREQVRNLIFNQRLETFSQGYLNELRFALDIEVVQ